MCVFLLPLNIPFHENVVVVVGGGVIGYLVVRKGGCDSKKFGKHCFTPSDVRVNQCHTSNVGYKPEHPKANCRAVIKLSLYDCWLFACSVTIGLLWEEGERTAGSGLSALEERGKNKEIQKSPMEHECRLSEKLSFLWRIPNARLSFISYYAQVFESRADYN